MHGVGRFHPKMNISNEVMGLVPSACVDFRGGTVVIRDLSSR
jgi:hypothetical protein